MKYRIIQGLVACSFAASAMGASLDAPVTANLEVDHGVCRGLNPKCFSSWPRAATAQYRVLLYTRTGISRHADLGPALLPGLNPPLAEENIVQREMKKLVEANGMLLDYTEDVAQLQWPLLGSYNAVIFYSTSRDILDDGAKTGLRQYMRAGGGFVGIHNAFGTLYNWPYYEGLLGNTNFYNHGPLRRGAVVIVDANDASTKGLPPRWQFKDEWYNLYPFPSKVRFLATVDEKSWTPVLETTLAAPSGSAGQSALPYVVGRHPGHGDFHPVAWCQYYDGGKVWVTTLGHDAGDFSDDDEFPGAKEFQAMILGGIKSVMGAAPFCKDGKLK
jgi:type 1 glutamine amidotransferase